MKPLCFLFSIIILTSCSGGGGGGGGGVVSKSGKTTPTIVDPTIDKTIIFSGITQTTDKSDTSITIHWTPHPSAVRYIIYDLQSGTPVSVATVNDPKLSSITLNNLDPAKQYKFVVKVQTVAGLYDGNTQIAPITMNQAPSVPSELIIVSQNPLSGIRPNPKVRVSGVKVGDTVKLYRGDGCSNEIGSQKVEAGTSVDIVTLPLEVGENKISAASFNFKNNSSGCGSPFIYTRLACPSNFVPVNSPDSESDFCVAKFEMKNKDGVAVSESQGLPWTEITQVEAKTKCLSLNNNSAGYDLISNSEWMITAKDIEKTPGNWTEGVVGLGKLFRGHSDNSPSAPLEGFEDTNPYHATLDNSESGKEQRRSFQLSSGEIVWDMSGNVDEWTDWSQGGTAPTPGPTICLGQRNQLPLVQCSGLSLSDYLPGNPAQKENYNWSSFGVGEFYGGLGGAALRGGKWNTTNARAGIFTLRLLYSANDSEEDIGFRCVYRPQSE